MTGASANGAVGDADYVAVQRFLHHEAALLDGRDYQRWFALLTDDIVYQVSAQVARDAEAGVLDYTIVDEGSESLKLRVDQISDPKLTRAENPPSMTRRFVSNFQVGAAASPDTFVVDTNLLVYRFRATAPDGGFYVGERRDVLRRIDGALRLARRNVRLDHTTLVDGSLSILL